MTCSYCTEPATTHIQVRVGELPPQIVKDNDDKTSIQIIRFCRVHAQSILGPVMRRRVA
jgi:hypothetical protein